MPRKRPTSCPHCDSTNIVPLNPAVPNPGSQVTWYECADCGRLFNRPADDQRDPSRLR